MMAIFWKVLALVGFTLIYSAGASAQATRTWVSGVGDDANPCSRTAPCKTFAGAISKTAAGGQINCLDSGGFGAVTITKAIAIECDGVIGGVLASGTNGIVINAGTNDVVYLSGLSIHGVGTGLNGINFLNGKALHVKNTVIRSFTQKGISFTPTANTASLVVQDSVIADNNNGTNGGGILLKPAATFNAIATIMNVSLNRNLYGLRAEDGARVTLSKSDVTANNSTGVAAVSVASPVFIRVVNSTLSDNGGTGARVSGAQASIVLLNASIFGNNVGIEALNGGSLIGTTPDTSMSTGNVTDGSVTGNIPLQ